MTGFLLGRLVNELSVANVQPQEVVTALFSVTARTTNLLTWLLAGILLLDFLLRKRLHQLHSSQRYDLRFADLVLQNKDSLVSPFEGIGWGSNLSLQLAPDICEGWHLDEINVHHDRTSFILVDEFRRDYERYKTDNMVRYNYAVDNVKIMLVRVSAASLATPVLHLQTMETRWSTAQYFRHEVAERPSRRSALIGKLIDGEVQFAHCLTLQLVVVTRDDKVLIVKRYKVDIDSDTWSCSIEEQLSAVDVAVAPDEVVSSVASRLLKDELGLGSVYYDSNELRILSVFLEADVLNISFCGYVRLNITSNELDRLITGLPRADHEFSEWMFITFEDLRRQLEKPTRRYHRTVLYRMLMALIHRFGEAHTIMDLHSMSLVGKR